MTSQSTRNERSFVRRHAGKLVLGAAVAGGYYAYTNYSHLFSLDYWLPDEFRRLKTVLDDQSLYADRQRAQPGLAATSSSTGSDPAANVAELHDRLHDMLTKLISLANSKLGIQLDSDELRRELRSCEGDSNKKLALWEQLRLNSWTKCIVAIYVLSHSILLLSVKLAVAVRYIRAQKQTATAFAAKTWQPVNSIHDEQALQAALAHYLDAVDFVVEQGLENCIAAAHECVEQLTTPIGLATPVDKITIHSVLCEVRKLIENKQCAVQKAASFSSIGRDAEDVCESRSESIMQTNFHIDFMLSKLDIQNASRGVNGHVLNSEEAAFTAQLYRETVQILRSTECNMVMACLLETAFNYVADELGDFITLSPTSAHKQNEPITNLVKSLASIPHVKVLPAFEKLANNILAQPGANSLCDTLLNLPYLSLFDRRVQAGQVVAVPNMLTEKPAMSETAAKPERPTKNLRPQGM